MPGQLQAGPAAVPAPLPPLPALGGSAASVPIAKTQSGASTSTTGQFIVHGDDLKLRSALSSKCEEYANELRTLLRDKQPWKLPIIVLVNSGTAAKKPGKPVSTAISQLTHGGFHIQVNVNMRPDLNPDDVRQELVRALLAERILRDQREIVSKRPLLLPDWLFVGVQEALDYRKRARPSALFAAIFKSGKIFGIEEIIEASADDVDDALSRTIYRTSSCALVLALLDQPDGGLRMDKFLNALASDARPEREILNQWYPNFASSDASLNKWWALQLATLASPSAGEPLSPQDTLAMLEEALIFRFRAAPGEAPPQPSRRATPPSSRPAPAPARSPEVAASPPPAVEESQNEEAASKVEAVEKPGFMSRLNPFSRRRTTDDDIAAAIEAAAKEEAESSQEKPADAPPPAVSLSTAETADEAPPPPPTQESPAERRESGRKPLFNRFFGDTDSVPEKTGQPEPAATESKPAEAPTQARPSEAKPAPAKPAALTKEAPAPAPKPQAAPPPPEPSEEEAKKPSNLNPLNWFRGGKKDKSEPTPPPSDAPVPAPETENQPKKSASSSAGSERDPLMTALRSSGSATFMLMQQAAVAEGQPPQPTQNEEEGEKRGFLGGLFGRKKPAKDAAEPEAPVPTPAKAEEKPAPASKEKAKPAEKPDSPAPAESATTPETVKDSASEEDTKNNPQARRPLRLRLFGGDKKGEMENAAEPEKVGDLTPPPVLVEEKKTQAAKTEPTSKPKQKSAVAPAPAAPAEVTQPPPAKQARGAAATLPIEDYALVIKRKDFNQISARNAVALTALQSRASILFRPIVADYLQILADLQKGKTKGMDARLKVLRKRSDEALARSKAVRDALDLHEANGSPAMSGLFKDYLELPKTIENELPPREDSISRYLDALDKEFQ